MAVKGKYIYDWPRPMVTVDAAVFRPFEDKFRILLIQRGKEPFKGFWALPGGFVEMDEELDDAAARELSEETGLRNVKLEQIQTYGGIGRDPRGRVISILYMGIVRADVPELSAADDASDAQWFDISRLPEEIAFDHRMIIEFAARKLDKMKLR
jgi:8-oxo-dGTP diphosphatase